MPGVVGGGDADVEQRDREDRDRDPALGPLAELAVGREGGEYEADEGDDEAQPGDQGQDGGGIVRQLDETVIEAGRQATEVGRDRDVLKDTCHSVSPLPACPALTDRLE